MAGLLVPTSPASAEGVGAEGPATSLSSGSSGISDISGAHAQTVVDDTLDTEPATYIGLIFPTESGHLATKVRAIGADGTVCGTAEVQRTVDGDAWYRLYAAGAETRPGCPAAGEALAFRLLYGSVDSGRFAIASQPVRYAAGERFLVSLTPTPDSTHADWLGTTVVAALDAALDPGSADGADTPRVATLTWVGPDGTPTGDALASLRLDELTSGDDDAPAIALASHYDATSRQWTSYTPGGPSFLQTYPTVAYGDVVYLRLR